MKSSTTFKHSGHIGDAICSLPVIREWCRKNNKKAIIYLAEGVLAAFPEGTTHSTKNADGAMVCLNREVIDMLIPLLKAQPYVEDAKVWEEEKIDIDLDNMRTMFVNMPYSCLSRVYFFVYPDLACDLSEAWLTVPDSDKDLAKGKIIISRSERYHSPNDIDYSFLKPFEDELLFSGTMREYNNFCMNYDLNIKKLVIKDFLELAQAIKQCKFHVSNQTMAYQLSQGQKTPRMLELCNYAPNIIPIGKDAFDYWDTFPADYYFYRLNGMEKEYKEMYLEKNKDSVKHEIDITESLP